MPPMECYACSNEPTKQCRRCARVYCELHGGDLCAECASPSSSLPSFNLYRGSLLALLIGTAIALWLLVRPPGSGNGREVIITQLTPTPIVTQEETTPRATARSTTVATPTVGTPAATSQPGATGTPAGPTETRGPRRYVVQDGDTLIGIAGQFAPAGVGTFAYAQQIAAASGLSSVDDPIQPGQSLTLP